MFFEYNQNNRGRIFSCVRPFNERAVSNPDRSMHRSLWVLVIHSLFIEGSHVTKNMDSELTIYPSITNSAQSKHCKMKGIKKVIKKFHVCIWIGGHLPVCLSVIL